jgi:hypothetical protein
MSTRRTSAKGVEDCVNCGLVGDIERQRQGSLAKLCGQFTNRIGIAVGENDPVAGLQKGLTDSSAHPAGCASNQGNLWRIVGRHFRRFPLCDCLASAEAWRSFARCAARVLPNICDISYDGGGLIRT